MTELVIEEALPDGLDSWVCLILHTAIVIINLAGLVHEPLLHPSLLRIDNGFVLGDMLFFDRGYFSIELPGNRIGEHRPDGHIVIVCLVLAGHNSNRVELADRRRFFAVVTLA